jgi:hypothetical protein
VELEGQEAGADCSLVSPPLGNFSSTELFIAVVSSSQRLLISFPLLPRNYEEYRNIKREAIKQMCEICKSSKTKMWE